MENRTTSKPVEETKSESVGDPKCWTPTDGALTVALARELYYGIPLQSKPSVKSGTAADGVLGLCK